VVKSCAPDYNKIREAMRKGAWDVSATGLQKIAFMGLIVLMFMAAVGVLDGRL